MICLIIFTVILSGLLFSKEVLASANNVVNPILPNNLTSMSGVDFIAALLKTIIGVALLVGVVVFFFSFLIGAVKWITAGGDKGKLEDAKNQIQNSLIGLLILFSIFAVLSLVQVVFNVSLLEINLEPLKIR